MLKIVDDVLRLAFVALFGFILFCVGVAPVHPSSYTEWGGTCKEMRTYGVGLHEGVKDRHSTPTFLRFKF